MSRTATRDAAPRQASRQPRQGLRPEGLAALLRSWRRDVSAAVHPGAPRTSPAEGEDRESAERSEVRAALVRFTGVGLVALLLIGVVTVAVTWQLAGRQALEETKVATQRLGDLTLGPLLGDVVRDRSPDLRALDAVVDARISDGSVLGVTVWSPDWRVLYSDRDEVVGTRHDRPDWAAQLLVDREPRAALVHASESEGRLLVAGDTEVVEVYDVTTVAGQDLVVEAYYPESFVRQHQWSLLRLLLPVGVIGLMLLQVTQLPLALRLANRLQNSSDSRRRLLAQAVAASDLERRRIARDLHDEVIQDLAGASYALEAMEADLPPAGREMSTRARSVVRQAVGNLRGVLTELYPVDLDDVGLEAAVQELAQPLRATGTQVDVQVPPEVALDRTTSVLVYRVVREALRNVEKHAGAGHVAVRLTVAGDEAVLSVTDDGRGFDTDAAGPRGHLGLHLVRDTVTEVGGSVSLTSAPGRGTCLLMRVPAR